jgi:type II secretory pathway pseudopilin PulG
MIKFITSFFTGGFGGYLIVAGIVGILASGGSYFIVKNIYDAKLAQSESAAASFRASVAERDSASVTASLTQLQGFIAGMHSAELNFGALQSQLNGKFAAIEKDMKNAPPVPIDCVIDPVRLRALRNATAAANANASTATTH